jgi:hypothetical protein
MRTFPCLFLAILVLLGCAGGSTTPIVEEPTREYVVGFRDTESDAADYAIAESICDAYGAELMGVLTFIGAFRARMTPWEAQAMASDPRVEVVEENGEVFPA